MRMLIAAALLLGSSATPVLAQESYKASGTEPFWSATIDARTITLKQAGMPDVTVPKPRPIIGINGERYETPRLSMDITHVKCSDGMSDRTYRDTVVISQGRRTLRGCGGDFTVIPKPGPAASILEGDWRIEAISGRRVARGTSPDISFRGGRVSGDASCNRFNGSFDFTRGRLKTGPLASTRRMCADRAQNNQEFAVLRILEQPLSVTSNRGGKLVLTARDGRTLTLVRSARR
ncbi:META domain-containing protein [Sphingomonas soli]|uniref:META domain-containing protein n=1 Tax=Sphingomonas soli TaxID=266127 RepID=UPI000A01C3C3|nr:META domain-containing protein [Sphingomonas soli]